MSTASGWAVVKSNGLIHIKTVSDTRRAAIINWLVTEKGVRIYAYHTDADIEAIWKHYGAHADCREVTISLAPAPPASRETLIGGTNFCGHGMMAVNCPSCSLPSRDRA